MSNPRITADKTPWYQWDTGLTVTVSGGAMTECHFANRKQGTAYVQAVTNGIARVPDELLQVAAQIKAYGYVSDGAGGQTYIEQTFEVIARNIPADYTYTKTAQKTIRDAEAARDEAVQAAKDAKTSALDADDSAVEASKSAQSAGDSASAAATSARTAAKSAGEAATSASEAKAAADKAVEDASELLKTYTDKAKTSADNAATSASNAADAASAAATSAGEAKQSATDASSAKVAAQTAKAEAEAAKSEAATSASNAESSATAAAKSASDAAASVGAINVIAPKSVFSGSSSDHESNVAIGNAATTVKYGAVAIGNAASANTEGVSVGDSSKSKDNAVAIGHSASSLFAGSVAIGVASATSKRGEFSIGSFATETVAEITREITHVSAPSAPSSASTKKYTDDNDAKTLTEAKKYTDDNTTNALIGKASGKLLHVEDAWPSPLLSVTIDGAYKQDGTPSPENPVPITVIENPVLKVIGRNFLDPDKMALTGTYYKNLNGELRIVSGDGRAWSMLPMYGVLPAGTYVIGGDSCEVRKALDDTVIVFTQTTKISFTLQVATEVKIKVGFGNPADQYPYISHCVIAMVNSGDAEYAPYVGVSLPITLPAEHPYLAALPDGTHDEIVVRDGRLSINCVLRREVMSSVASVGDTSSYQYVQISATTGKLIDGDRRFICDRFITNKKNAGGVYVAGGVNTAFFFCFPLGTFKDLSEAAAWFAANPTTVVYTDGAGAKAIDLGKVDDIPSLPETISNVWTDAELTTNMSMTYKQDVNVVIANLNAQIAALKGTTNEPPEVTGPTTE